jgi:hypothetical protein
VSAMADEQKYQGGLCLIASEGHGWMKNSFDRFHPVVQRRLRDSPFNICAGCVRSYGGNTIASQIAQIEKMEPAIRLDDIVKKR